MSSLAGQESAAHPQRLRLMCSTYPHFVYHLGVASLHQIGADTCHAGALEPRCLQTCACTDPGRPASTSKRCDVPFVPAGAPNATLTSACAPSAGCEQRISTRVQVAPLLYNIIQRLDADKSANVPVCEMIAFVFQRIVELSKATPSPDETATACAALQPLLQYEACLSASVRSRMLLGLEYDPPLHGLLHASVAVAHCDGFCTPQHPSVKAFALGVQSCASTKKVSWLWDVAMEACTSYNAAAMQACVCRKALLRRLLHHSNWSVIAQLPEGKTVTLASQPPGTTGRRFVVAARLRNDGVSELCCAPPCKLQRGNNVDGAGFYLGAWKVGADQSGGLEARFGVVGSSADVFAALADASSKWVHWLKTDTDCDLVEDDPSSWRMHPESREFQTTQLQQEYRGYGWPLAGFSNAAAELGYRAGAWKTPYDQPVWVCMWAREIDND